MAKTRLSQAHIRQLAEFRYQLRRFLHFSEEAARRAGVEPQQHSLLLQLKGLPTGLRPTISTVAERLLVKHHSAGELVDRAVERGLIERVKSEDDRREVYLRLTPEGERIIGELAQQHWEQVFEDGRALHDAIGAIVDGME